MIASLLAQVSADLPYPQLSFRDAFSFQVMTGVFLASVAAAASAVALRARVFEAEPARSDHADEEMLLAC